MDHEPDIIKPDDSVHRIMAAALAVFSEAGFAGARMDRIARRAGVNKALIYYHIGGKGKLYATVLHDIFGKTAATVKQAMADAATPEEKVRAYIRILGRSILGEPHKAPIILREFASGGLHFPEIVGRDLKGIIDALRAAMAEGAKTGVFIDTLPAAVHLMIVGTFNLYRAAMSLRNRQPVIDDMMAGMPESVADLLIGEVERLVLRAIKIKNSADPE